MSFQKYYLNPAPAVAEDLTRECCIMHHRDGQVMIRMQLSV